MNSIFPSDIINVSLENHFVKFNRKSRLIYIVVIMFFLVGTVSLFLIRTEITVQSRGVFRSATEPVELVSPVIAKVIETNLNENQPVMCGDTLVWLDCRKQTERIAYVLKRTSENELYLKDISSMLSFQYSDLTTSLYKTTHAQYRQKLSEYDMQIELFQKAFTRAKILFDNEVIPEAELEESQFQLNKIIEEKKNYVQICRNEWQQLSVNYHQENKDYASEVEGLKNEINNYAVVAPTSGHVTNYSGIKPGGFVTTGQTIAIISPDDQIMAEHLVSPQDIGFLNKNMPVVFQVDAFNYNQWGMATGTLIEISEEIYIVNNQPYFKVRSSLDQTHLSLKNGYQGKLKKGLTNTARYKVAKRTFAQLLFDKADDWLNPRIISE
ncbi:MAG: HlyD family secretion protein [Draconibacterium sp.]